MPQHKGTKYIFVTGGVLSGLGKGITAASIGNTLKNRGLRVNIQKCDQYLNVDAGTLNPAEHGEVFVTGDGAETDLDLGHYERFLDIELTQKSSLMSGRVLSQIISDEREGKYLGRTVQVIPHVTDTIQGYIEDAGEGFDVHIVEVGGTVGDYEGLAFVEAIREFATRVGRENCLYVHVVYAPYLETSKEYKTKPSQNAVRELRALGIIPDVLVVRSEVPAPDPQEVIKKLSIHTAVEPEGIALLANASSVYQVPLTLEETGLSDFIVTKLKLKNSTPHNATWKKLVKTATDDGLPVATIGVVAKYMSNVDTYMSVFEAIKAGGWAHNMQTDIIWIDAEELEATEDPGEILGTLDGIVVPGGFGSRALEGKIKAATFAMESKVPYLGLCLGMQMAVVALARKVVDPSASALELDPDTPHPVIHLMESQRRITEKGGTMRLGNYKCMLVKGSVAREAYGSASVTERHRHRYEFNNEYRDILTKKGLVLSGLSPNGDLVEIIELEKHPFFVATQFHPEFRSRPNKPHPLFVGFMNAIKNNLQI